MTTRSMRRERWGDDRLEAAFAVRASRTRTPPDLLEATRMMLVAVPMRATSWRRLLVPAAVLVLAIGTLGGGVALLGDRPGAGTFRDGPSVGLKTFDGGEFAFDYPAAWLGYDSSAAFSGGSSIAVLGTQPVEPRCGDERHVDINCVHEQTLEPGDIRVFIGTGAYRGGTLLDRADIENGTSTRLEIDGMPAIRDEFAPRPDSYYHEDMLVHWSIVRPGMDGTNVIRIEAMLREPGVAASRAQLDALIASFRFQDRVAPSPTESPVASEVADLPITSVREVPSRPWPPDGATIVELTKVGSGRPPVRVAVVDQTRHLVEARAATAAEAALRDITLRAVWANDLADRRVLVQWGGSMCDDRLVLTIRASEAGAPAALLLDGRRTSPCRLALLHNAIVLQFDTDVSEADLFRAYRIGD